FHTALALTDPAVSAAVANGMAVSYQLSDLAFNEEKAFKDSLSESNSMESKYIADAFSKCSSETGINISAINRISCLGDGISVGEGGGGGGGQQNGSKGNEKLVTLNPLIEETAGCNQYGTQGQGQGQGTEISALKLVFCRAEKVTGDAAKVKERNDDALAMIGDVVLEADGSSEDKITFKTRVIPGTEDTQNSMVKLVRLIAQERRADVAAIVQNLCNAQPVNNQGTPQVGPFERNKYLWS
ncbi:MAG: hypothetical protein AAF399_15615, partial [Bacteroidota bacterium]